VQVKAVSKFLGAQVIWRVGHGPKKSVKQKEKGGFPGAHSQLSLGKAALVKSGSISAQSRRLTRNLSLGKAALVKSGLLIDAAV
jgi:hypothetical protein